MHDHARRAEDQQQDDYQYNVGRVPRKPENSRRVSHLDSEIGVSVFWLQLVHDPAGFMM